MYKLPGGGVGAAGGGVGTLAATGANLTWWVVIGTTLVVIGVAATIATRRRTRRLGTPRE